MKRVASQFLSYLLLVSMLATIVPADLVHHHEEEAHCDLAHELIENDPCHQSIYHPHEGTEHHCQHDFHLSNTHSSCEFCQFFSSQRFNSLLQQRIRLVFKGLMPPVSGKTTEFYPSVFSLFIFDRGPPSLGYK